MLRCSMSYEKRAECTDGDDDHCDSGFGLKPEDGPCGINLAVVDIATSHFDDRGDCCEDAEA